MPELDELLAKERREAEERAAQRRAEEVGLDYLNLVSVTTPTEIQAMQMVSELIARAARAVPVQIVKKRLILAVYDPRLAETRKLIDELKQKYELTVVVTTEYGLEHAWHHYAYIKKESEELGSGVNIDAEHIERINKEIKTAAALEKAITEFESPLISHVLEVILGGAVALRASDIHLEPVKDGSVLRLRVDGMLHVITKGITPAIHHALVTRIKLLSELKLNITEEPQDGRFTVSLPGRAIEIRTSVLPSEYGETAVMRLLDPNALKINMEELGWRPDDLAIIKAELEKPNGLILNTGPTGSGKTTTLYSFLAYKVRPEIKVITVEDPIEYHLEGVSQTQTDPGAGYTFASGLRSILRQDPDVILVGEIRDKETAEMAMNAALTGHIVFSTLHTNSAVGAIPRLLELGVKPNTLGPSLSLVIAQRLVRKLCEHCKKEVRPDDEMRENIKTFFQNLPPRVAKEPYASYHLYEPVGCDVCGGTGYHGRISIFELFLVTKAIESAIYENPPETRIAELAEREGMVTMQEDGVLKALQGTTALEEVTRLTGPIIWKQT